MDLLESSFKFTNHFSTSLDYLCNISNLISLTSDLTTSIIVFKALL